MSQKPKGPGTIINDENVEYLFYVYVYVNRKERPNMSSFQNNDHVHILIVVLYMDQLCSHLCGLFQDGEYWLQLTKGLHEMTMNYVSCLILNQH